MEGRGRSPARSNRSKKLTAVIERLGCSVPKAVWHRNVYKACYSASPFYPVSELRLRQLFLQGDSNSARFLNCFAEYEFVKDIFFQLQFLLPKPLYNAQAVQILREVHYTPGSRECLECSNVEEHTQEEDMGTEDPGWVKDYLRDRESIPITGNQLESVPVFKLSSHQKEQEMGGPLTAPSCLGNPS